jgi:probable HAF family extracellular repeat protein
MRRKTLVVAVMLLCGAMLHGQGPGQARFRGWTIAPLPHLPGAIFSEAFDVNDRGDAVGWSGATFESAHAVLWRNGAAIDLGTLGGPQSRAFGINNRGQVVGEAEVAPGDSHAFLWEDGVMHDLAAAGPFNRAFAINERGDVVGHFQLQPLLWRDGVLTELTGLIVAFDVNDRLEVAGALVVEGTSTFHPAIWRDGTIIDLGLPEGSFGGSAKAINRRGVVVGDVDGRAFRWENGTREPLASLIPSGNAFALDVDESGLLVAGESMSNPNAVGGAPHAVVWLAGRPIDLGTLPGGTVSTAWAIADKGRFIAGFSTQAAPDIGRAVIWTSR